MHVSRTILSAAAIAVFCCAAARAEPRVEVVAARSTVLRAPILNSEGVRGVVCRDAFTSVRARYVRAERFDERGGLVETASAAIRGLPGYRGGCGVFAFESFPVGQDETVRLTVAASR